MSRRLHIAVRMGFLVALYCLAAFAEDHYLVKVKGDVNGIAQRYGLTVVKSLTGSAPRQHVLSSKGANPRTVPRHLSLEAAVQSAEAEKPVWLPGSKAAATIHPASTAAAGLPISSTPIRDYKSYAFSAYVKQPASSLGLGGGIHEPGMSEDALNFGSGQEKDLE